MTHGGYDTCTRCNNPVHEHNIDERKVCDWCSDYELQLRRDAEEYAAELAAPYEEPAA